MAVETVAQQRDHVLLLARERRHRDVAAFAGHHGPAVGGGHEGRDAEPGTGAERRERRARHALAAADAHDVRGRELRERPRDRSEVVDHLQAFQAQRLLERGLRESPADVDHLNFVADDRCGDGQRGARRLVARAAVIEINAQHAFDAREVGVLEDFRRELQAFVVDECATRSRSRRYRPSNPRAHSQAFKSGILALSS